MAVAQGEVTEANDALRLTKEDAAAEQAENNAALAAASAELQELRDVHADVSFPVSLVPCINLATAYPFSSSSDLCENDRASS